MLIYKIAAFSHDNQGGNPAGVVLEDSLPNDLEMQAIAKKVGYSETAFLKKTNNGFRIRYFAPEIEVPFCGHATIASGALLGQKLGAGHYKLELNKGHIDINVLRNSHNRYVTSFTSLPTHSEETPQAYIDEILEGFNFTQNDINESYPVYFASAGAKHLIIVLKKRSTLAAMKYDFDAVKHSMNKAALVTINLLWQESEQCFHSRNAFASGGVYEDPATGAAAAAFAGYLRDIEWKGSTSLSITQGEDMGFPSRLSVNFTHDKNQGIEVSGESRFITEM